MIQLNQKLSSLQYVEPVLKKSNHRFGRKEFSCYIRLMINLRDPTGVSSEIPMLISRWGYNELKIQLTDWCQNNCSGQYQIYNEIWFEKEEDAILLKLYLNHT